MELVLVEWKYTESYRSRTIAKPTNTVRWERPGAGLTGPDDPTRSALLAFADLLDDRGIGRRDSSVSPTASRQNGVHGDDQVRVGHAPRVESHLPPVFQRDSQLARGATIGDVWAKLLRHPDRYVDVDNSVLLGPATTSSGCVARYDPLT